jgi:hypothetical protein
MRWLDVDSCNHLYPDSDSPRPGAESYSNSSTFEFRFVPERDRSRGDRTHDRYSSFSSGSSGNTADE